MPGTITTDLVLIESCDAATAWTVFTGNNGLYTAQAVNTTYPVQNTGCLQVSGAPTILPAQYGQRLSVSPLNLSGPDVHIFWWQNPIAAKKMSTRALGGLRIYLSSSSTWTYPASSYSEWYVDGSDTNSQGGWQCYVINPNAPPPVGRSAGNLVTTSVKHIARVVSMTADLGGGVAMCYQDVLRYGTGLTVTQGTLMSPAKLKDIFAVDTNRLNCWGILTKVNNTYQGCGKFRFGTTNQTALTVFSDDSLTLLWADYPVSVTLNAFNLVGNANYSTRVTLGSFSGTAVTHGCTIGGSGNVGSTTHPVWSIFVGAYAYLELYGCRLSELYRVTLTDLCTIRGCSIRNFGDITPEGATLIDNTFTNLKTSAPILGTAALRLSSPASLASVSRCSFSDCAVALRIATPGVYTLNNLAFAGNTYDIENASTGAVTLLVVGGSASLSVLNSGVGATTSIVKLATLIITGIVGSGPVTPTGSEVRIFQAGTDTELSGVENCTSGVHTYTYNTLLGLSVDIVVLHEDYVYYRISNYPLPQGDSSLPIIQTLQVFDT